MMNSVESVVPIQPVHSTRQIVPIASRKERGSALLLTVIVTLLLMVLGLGITMSSLTEFRMSNEFQAHQQALMIADSGLGLTKNQLRGNNLVTLLTSSTQVPLYVNSGAESLYAYRNPRSPVEARKVDYAYPPSPVGSLSIRGMLTSPQGVIVGNGRYFAKLSDNQDGDGDPLVDSDDKYILRVLGIHRAPNSEAVSYGGTVKNAVAMVEALVKQDFSFDLGAPLTILGPDVNATFNGNSFDVTGDANHAGISVLNDDPGGGDGTNTLQRLYDSLGHNQYDNITGADGPYGDEPSIRDDTDAVRTSSNPDARNVLDPYFLMTFIRRIASAADIYYSGDTHLSGGGVELGTVDAPKITYVDGNLALNGSGSGAGILIVTGSFDYSGSFDYDGIVLVLGQGELDLSGANKSITGGVLVARIIEDMSGQYVLAPSVLRMNGNSNFFFNSSSIHMAMNLLPLKTLMWREITPGVEPAPAG